MKKTEKKKDYTIHVGVKEQDHTTILELAKKAEVPKSTMARTLLKEALEKRRQHDLIERFQKKADEILENQTPESIMAWFEKERSKKPITRKSK